MTYSLSVRVAAPFKQVVHDVRDALAAQGFGILTEIDVSATMREKLGAELEDYVILGACNPPLAHRALTADRAIGTLLPCNVVVRSAPEDTIVEAMDPQVMAGLSAEPEVAEVAAEAAARIRTALTAVGGEVTVAG